MPVESLSLRTTFSCSPLFERFLASASNSTSSPLFRIVLSTSTQTPSGMAEITVDPSLLDIPPPLPPRFRCATRAQCLFGPSSSAAVQIRPMAVKCIDEYHVFPCTLDVSHSDFDANSVGFVDIQELRALEKSDCTSVKSLPTPVRKRSLKRRSFASLSKLFLRCRTAPRGYGSLDESIRNSTQDHYLNFAHTRKQSAFDTPSIVLPRPPIKKHSFGKAIKSLMFCIS